jgi:bifunctional polynucleotide phosphatase/kinase
MSIDWLLGEYLFGSTKDFKFKSKVAAFDFDGTLVKNKSGKRFPINEDDWEFFSDDTKNKLIEFNKKGYCMIIISNQKGIGKNDKKMQEWKNKLDKIHAELKIPLIVFASIKNDMHRKPLPTFWQIIAKKMEENKINSSCLKDSDSCFYCGDACGRKDDFSDTDLKFALNYGIKFVIPEFVFLNEENKIGEISYPDIKKLKVNNNNKLLFVPNKKNKELIIMVGYPGSGKSTYVTDQIMKHNYVRINQDTLGTKAKCIKEAKKVFEKGDNLVIDNTNRDIKTRKEYIDLAKKYEYNIRCIVFTTTLEHAKHNSYYRAYKSNFDTGPIEDMIYYGFRKAYEEPSKDEDINVIEKIDFNKQINDPDYNLYFF